jgi:hypothetical protein
VGCCCRQIITGLAASYYCYNNASTGPPHYIFIIIIVDVFAHLYALRVFSFHFFFALFVLNHSKDAALPGEAEHMAHGISQRRGAGCSPSPAPEAKALLTDTRCLGSGWALCIRTLGVGIFTTGKAIRNITINKGAYRSVCDWMKWWSLIWFEVALRPFLRAWEYSCWCISVLLMRGRQRRHSRILSQHDGAAIQSEDKDKKYIPT